MVTLPVTLVDP